MNERTLFFLDDSLSVVSVCDEVISLEYSELFCGAGDFECVVPASGAAALSPDGYVMTGDGLVYAVESIGRDSENGTAAIRAKGLLSLFSRRVIPESFAAKKTPEGCISYLAQTYGASALPGELEARFDDEGAQRDFAIESGSLTDRLVRIASSASKGLRLTYNSSRELFFLDIFDGTDKTLGGASGVEPVFLSESFGTVCGVRDISDRSRYINRVIVRGAQNSAGDAESVTVDAADCGFSDGIDDSAEKTRESFVQSAIGKSLYTTAVVLGDPIFDSAGYTAALRERGRQELSLHRVCRTLEAELIGDAPSYAEVGDICTLSSGATDVQTAQIICKTRRFRGGEQSCFARLKAL